MPPPHAARSARLLWWLAAATLVLALVLGGGTVQGLRSDAVVQLASLPLLGLAGTMLLGRPAPPCAVWASAVAAAIMMLPIVQLIPLPAEVWTRLPGRSVLMESFGHAAIELPWWPLSLDPAATWRAFLSLLPPLAVFLAVVCMGVQGRRKLVLLLAGLGLLAVLLGLVQLAQGPASPLRVHAITNLSSSVGVFANRNHHAALLYCVLPFAAACTIAAADLRPRGIRLAAGASAIAALLLGIGMAQSRAGLLLGLAALVASAFIPAGGRDAWSGRHATVVAAGLAGELLVVHYALPGLLDRFETAVIDDYRLDILGVGARAAETFLPFGSGFGTFQPVYQMHDRPEALLTSYVNHAHNDWLELWIEGGWLIAPVAAGLVAWLGVATFAAWRRPAGRTGVLDAAIPRAASITIWLLLLHSLVDYPLRTTALATVFALCCALLVRPTEEGG